MTDLDLIAQAPARPPTPVRPRSPLPVLMCGVFMIVLDFFVVNVALPSMQADLHASTSAIEWVVAGYGLTCAVFLIAGGRLGRHGTGAGGRSPPGSALFVVASAACGLAPTPQSWSLPGWSRASARALISPNVLSIIGVAYPGPARVRAITVYGMVMGLAAAGGQLIGGILIQANLLRLGWRTVFLINVPVGARGAGLHPAAGARVHGRAAQRRPADGQLDVGGNVLATCGLTALVLPLVEGTELNWPAWTWVSLAAAPLLFTAFVAHERRQARRGGPGPARPGPVRGSAACGAGLGTQLVFWCGQASFFLVLALYLQNGRGLDALHAGLVFSILAAAYLVTSMRAPALTLRFGRSLIAVGALTLAAGHGLVLLAVAAGGGIGWLRARAWCWPARAWAWHHPADHDRPGLRRRPERAGAVSGALATMQQVGNALGVAVTGVIFFGALHGGERALRPWLELSLAQLGVLLVIVAGLTRLLPRLDRGLGGQNRRSCRRGIAIGDFARMTHLSVKALRHYHDVGLLEPAQVDPWPRLPLLRARPGPGGPGHPPVPGPGHAAGGGEGGPGGAGRGHAQRRDRGPPGADGVPAGPDPGGGGVAAVAAGAAARAGLGRVPVGAADPCAGHFRDGVRGRDRRLVDRRVHRALRRRPGRGPATRRARPGRCTPASCSSGSGVR